MMMSFDFIWVLAKKRGEQPVAMAVAMDFRDPLHSFENQRRLTPSRSPQVLYNDYKFSLKNKTKHYSIDGGTRSLLLVLDGWRTWSEGKIDRQTDRPTYR